MITGKTTLDELINEYGLIKSGMIEVWNDRIKRKQDKIVKEKNVEELSEFIAEFAQSGVLYKTKTLTEAILKEKPNMFQHISDPEKKRYAAHSMITAGLKKLVASEKFVVVNKTNNHAHNRYGLKPDLEEIPTFESILDISKD